MVEVLEKKWTIAEYLAFERPNKERHELIFGNLITMGGANLYHNQLKSNLSYLLNRFLFYKIDYDVFQSDMRVLDSVNNSFCYPDLVVVQGEPKFLDNEFDTLTNPMVIIEVMSKSTQRFDKVEKFEIYKNLDSLREYVLISQEQMQVKVFRKIAKNHWELFDYEQLSDEVEVLNGELKIPLKSIYNKVKFS
jgi:Uma2 family endonuclease